MIILVQIVKNEDTNLNIAFMDASEPEIILALLACVFVMGVADSGCFPVASYAMYTVCKHRKRKHSTFIQRQTRTETMSDIRFCNFGEGNANKGETLILKGSRQKANVY